MQKSFLIQNADVNAKKSDYISLKADELLVYSTFYTIQGEGPFAGHPAFFIRLAGCNFGAKDTHCKGCDTKFFLAAGKPRTFASLIAEAEIALRGNGLIVVTGGEPCLQKNLAGFCSVVTDRLTVQIETNGSQTAVMDRCAAYGAKIVCSPKAGPKGYATEMLAGDQFTIACLKFVVTADPTDKHHTIPEWAFTWVRGAVMYNPRTLYVSPLTVYRRPAGPGEIVSAWDTTLVDHAATAANYRYAAQIALTNRNVIVSTQQHTFLCLE